jgi:hypothetical protein
MEEEAARAGEHAGDKDRHANQNHDERCMDAQVEHNWGGRFRLVSVPSCHGRVMSLVGDLDNDESVGAILRNVGLERSSLTLGTFVEERDGSHPLWENIECVELHSCGSREYTITVHGERNFYDIRLTISRILPYVLTHTPNGEKCPDGSIAKTDFTVTREALIKKQHVNPGTFGVVLRGTPPDGAKGGIRIAQRELCDPWEPMETRRSGYFLVVKTSLPHESKKTEKGSLHPPMRKRASKQNKNGGLGGESCAWRKGQVTSRNSNCQREVQTKTHKQTNKQTAETLVEPTPVDEGGSFETSSCLPYAASTSSSLNAPSSSSDNTTSWTSSPSDNDDVV